MKPLAVEGGAASDVFLACVVVWVVFELALAIRAGEGIGSSWTVVPLTVSLGGAVALGQFAARQAPGVALPGSGWWPVALGFVVFALGLALRASAVHELGRFFTFTVVVQADHRVVDTGPYRLVRHPSYTGLLMVELGLGIELGTWLSIASCLLPPVIAVALRVHHEEKVLIRELGERYRAYMARTHRLVPGVWGVRPLSRPCSSRTIRGPRPRRRRA
jgi:protein-S-isoprenylcysteine O-methyltransferase Ste14